MSKNTGEGHRVGMMRDRAQLQNPVTGRYVKIDTSTGRILANKKTPGKFAGIREITKEK